MTRGSDKSQILIWAPEHVTLRAASFLRFQSRKYFSLETSASVQARMSPRSLKPLMVAVLLTVLAWMLLAGPLYRPPRWEKLPSIFDTTNSLPAQATQKIDHGKIGDEYPESLESAENQNGSHTGHIPAADSAQRVPGTEITAYDNEMVEGLPHANTNNSKASQPEHAPSTPTNDERTEKVRKYVQAILDPSDTVFERMQCPSSLGSRYKTLKSAAKQGKVKYFIALDLYQVEALLPRLMGTTVEVLKYLGPENCAVSVVEGRSDDLTYDILVALRMEIESMSSHFFLTQSDINPLSGELNRIEALAMLRNLALAPLNETRLFDNETVIVFSNDIASCPEDILELLYQHRYQEATMTCAMDWIHDGNLFYDIWVSRSMNGDLFFEVPQDSSWAYSENLFWNHEFSRERFDAFLPFQVYSCWGGMVTLEAQHFIDGTLTFRVPGPDECFMGEPTVLAKDMWKLGNARILTVPSVAVGYSNEEGGKIKQTRGYVSDHVDLVLNSKANMKAGAEKVEWKGPPGMIKCAPEWQRQSWVDPF